jgi:hypothetical protein
MVRNLYLSVCVLHFGRQLILVTFMDKSNILVDVNKPMFCNLVMLMKRNQF